MIMAARDSVESSIAAKLGREDFCAGCCCETPGDAGALRRAQKCRFDSTQPQHMQCRYAASRPGAPAN